MHIFKRGNSSIFLFIIIGFLSFAACKKTPKNNNQSTYKVFSLNHQDWKSKRVTQFINDINYTATEVPLEYYFLKNNLSNSSKIDSLYKLNAKERVIEIEFQHVKESDLLLQDYTNKTYEEAVKYMAFTIEKDFMVITSSNDTIKCSGVNFERNFKLAPFKRVLLYFTDINPQDDIKLIYHDYLFGSGIIKFNLEYSPLKV